MPQLYLTEAAGEKRMRLHGFERVALKPSESRRVTVTADPRLLARFDPAAGRWRITGGRLPGGCRQMGSDLVLTADAALTPRLFGN